jgi:hypothetical protein
MRVLTSVGMIALGDRLRAVSFIADIGTILNPGNKNLSRVATVRRSIINEERRPNIWL